MLGSARARIARPLLAASLCLLGTGSSEPDPIALGLRSRDPVVVRRALDDVKRLESRGARYIADVARLVAVLDYGESAACALEAIGSASVLTLIDRRHAEDPHLRARVAASLRRMGSRVVPELAEALRGSPPSRDVGALVAAAGDLGPLAHDLAASLEALLATPLGREAASTLLAGGWRSARAEAELLSKVADGGGPLSDMSLRALARLGPAARSVVPALRAAIRTAPEQHVVSLIKALWRVDGDTDVAVEHLVSLLRERGDDMTFVMELLDGIGFIGPEAQGRMAEVLPLLLRYWGEAWAISLTSVSEVGLPANAEGFLVRHLKGADPALRERVSSLVTVQPLRNVGRSMKYGAGRLAGRQAREAG